MADSFTEVTSQSWFGRIGNSIKGILFGIVLIPVAIILLFWNEGRAVKTARSLKEGASAVVSVSADDVSKDNDGNLIHLSGQVTTDEEIKDPIFAVTAKALRLTRTAEMYQWKEDKSSETHKKLGGGEETVTKFTYKKEWSDKHLDSAKFKESGGHENPDHFPIDSDTVVSDQATLGAFKVPGRIIQQMHGDTPLPVTDDAISTLPAKLKSKARLTNGAVYLGEDPDAPAVGDTRVTFKSLPPGVFSILAAQTGNTLQPYETKAGDSLERVESGDVSAANMFQHAASENAVLTWILRAVGFILMFIGLAMILAPLSVLADIVPFIGGIVGFGTGVLSFFVALSGTLIVIAISWVVVRPVLGITLLVLGLGALIFGWMRVHQHRRARATAAVPAAA